jgi:predicted nucleic acid-binding protein
VWVLDSSIWVDFYGGGPLAGDCQPYVTLGHEIITPVQVLYEVYRWARRNGGDATAMEIVSHLEFTRFAPGDVTTAIVAVDMSADHGLAAADAMIYATARLQGAELVTADADFRGLPGVTLLGDQATGGRA